MLFNPPSPLEIKVLTKRFGLPNSAHIDTYLANDGYQAFVKSLDMTQDAIIQEVKDSNLRGRGGTSMWVDGADMAEVVKVPFIDAALGVVIPLSLMHGRSIEVPVPPGVRDGDTITITGMGFPGFGGGKPGDLNVIVQVQPHPVLRRDGFDVCMALALPAAELAAGARVMVPGIGGDQGVEIAAGSTPGDIVRLEGMGFRDPVSGRRGDQVITLAARDDT